METFPVANRDKADYAIIPERILRRHIQVPNSRIRQKVVQFFSRDAFLREIQLVGALDQFRDSIGMGDTIAPQAHTNVRMAQKFLIRGIFLLGAALAFKHLELLQPLVSGIWTPLGPRQIKQSGQDLRACRHQPRRRECRLLKIMRIVIHEKHVLGSQPAICNKRRNLRSLVLPIDPREHEHVGDAHLGQSRHCRVMVVLRRDRIHDATVNKLAHTGDVDLDCHSPALGKRTLPEGLIQVPDDEFDRTCHGVLHAHPRIMRSYHQSKPYPQK